MRFSKKLLSISIASILAAQLTACKDTSPSSAKTEAASFSADAAKLESALKVRLGEFETVLQSDQISKTFDYTPPKLLNKLLSSRGVTREQLNNQIDTVWKQTLNTVEIQGFNLDHVSNPVDFLESGRPYKIIPTSSSMKVKFNGSEILSVSETLAFVEAGEWYFVRLDEPSLVAMFREAYPEFSVVNVMAPVTTMDGKKIGL